MCPEKDEIVYTIRLGHMYQLSWDKDGTIIHPPYLPDLLPMVLLLRNNRNKSRPKNYSKNLSLLGLSTGIDLIQWKKFY